MIHISIKATIIPNTRTLKCTGNIHLWQCLVKHNWMTQMQILISAYFKKLYNKYGRIINTSSNNTDTEEDTCDLKFSERRKFGLCSSGLLHHVTMHTVTFQVMTLLLQPRRPQYKQNILILNVVSLSLVHIMILGVTELTTHQINIVHALEKFNNLKASAEEDSLTGLCSLALQIQQISHNSTV